MPIAYIFATRRRIKFQPMKSIRSNSLSLKVLKALPFPGCKDIGMRIFQWMATTQFLWVDFLDQSIIKGNNVLKKILIFKYFSP